MPLKLPKVRTARRDFSLHCGRVHVVTVVSTVVNNAVHVTVVFAIVLVIEPCCALITTKTTAKTTGHGPLKDAGDGDPRQETARMAEGRPDPRPG